MRLYRGMTRAHDPSKVTRDGMNFTDCPWVALGYARGRNGVLLVIEIPDDDLRHVQEADWFTHGPRRFLLYRGLERFLVATVAAKEARAVVSAAGVRAASAPYKSEVLKQAIGRHLREPSQPLRGLTLASVG